MHAAPVREPMQMAVYSLPSMATAMTGLPAPPMNAAPVQERMQTVACSRQYMPIAMTTFSAPQMPAILQDKVRMQTGVSLLSTMQFAKMRTHALTIRVTLSKIV